MQLKLPLAIYNNEIHDMEYIDISHDFHMLYNVECILFFDSAAIRNVTNNVHTTLYELFGIAEYD